ncbi:hypothetical protein LZQ00_16860 [Sphingobacterium sp. SRCM116780]|uniref:hypothetical protein n=1 Tax=Sphingobacterium sp. SRCM116780 TaxID=2907623 RepID=UPI001F417170|nr:hypothetical protein [Sphingobacterium sp. SRCM116780]UIR55919.1 hypothetical protein LZQ00_16860 [Sphingobacterium sp. SRCM116780]
MINNLTVFELALLFALAENCPSLYTHIDKLSVTERECTGVGQYIFLNYKNEIDLILISEDVLSVDKLIEISELEVGLGFVGNVNEGKLSNIEIFVYGSDDWNCDYTGFQLKNLRLSQ